MDTYAEGKMKRLEQVRATSRFRQLVMKGRVKILDKRERRMELRIEKLDDREFDIEGVYVYTCVCFCICVCVYICPCVCVCIRIYICMNICVFIYLCVNVHTHKHTRRDKWS